jgi:hypothetical protein
MNRFFGLSVAPIFLASLIFLVSCTTNQRESVGLSDDLVFVSDTIVLEFEEKVYSATRNNRFAEIDSALYYVVYSTTRHSLLFHRLTSSPVEIFEILLSDSSRGTYENGVSDFFVHSFDSIFFIPDYGSENRTVYLHDRTGHITKSYSFSSNHFFRDRPFNFYSLLYCRMSVTSSTVFLPIFFYPNKVNYDWTVVGDYDEYASRPIFAILDMKTDSLKPFYYPLFFSNMNKRSTNTVYTSHVNSFYFNWQYTPFISKYIKNDGNTTLDSVLTINVADFVPFTDKNHLTFSGQAERFTVCDKLENMIFDPYRSRFYVLYSRGILFEETDNPMVSSFLEKPVYILVFDENLNYLHSKKFQFPEYAQGKHTIGLTRKHMLLPKITDFYKADHELFLIRVDLDSLNDGT